MSSTVGNDVGVYYAKLTTQLYSIDGPILTAIGSVGAVLCCIVFAQKTMRKNPGSVYFIAYSVANLFIILLTLLPVVLVYATGFDLSIYNIFFCKIVFYFRLVLPVLSRYYLILASIDRTLITSSNASIRQRSNHRLAYWSIAGVTLITVLFYIHLLVGINIYQLYPKYYLCYYQPGDYRTFTAYSNLLITGVVPWFLLSLFAVLTLRNLRKIRIQPVDTVPTAMNSHQSKDRQLATMLLCEILIYIIFISPTPIVGIYQQITQDQPKDIPQKVIETFVLSVVFFSGLIPPAANFYVNWAVSKTFRRKTAELFCKHCQHHLTHASYSQHRIICVIPKGITKQ